MTTGSTLPLRSALLVMAFCLHSVAGAAAANDEPAKPARQDPPPVASPAQPISSGERTAWFVGSTVGPRSLAVGLFSAGWGTAFDKPEEYGRDAAGFGKRYAMRLSGVAIGNGIEAGLGAVWGEDPRYERSTAASPGPRVRHAFLMTLMAKRGDGRALPAYARYTAIVGNNFVTNAWRAESERSVPDALARSALGLSGRLVSNLFEEFWPDIRRRVFRRHGRRHVD